MTHSNTVAVRTPKHVRVLPVASLASQTYVIEVVQRAAQRIRTTRWSATPGSHASIALGFRFCFHRGPVVAQFGHSLRLQASSVISWRLRCLSVSPMELLLVHRS